MNASNRGISASGFPTTQWTQLIHIIQSGDADAAWAAFAEFCEQYRPIVYRFFRRKGCDHQQAEDFTQEFFLARIVKRWQVREGFLFVARRSENRRFRGLLCFALWFFLKEQWAAQSRKKNGPVARQVPFEEAAFTEPVSESPAFSAIGAELDRQLALEILGKAAAASARSKWLLAHFRGEMSQAQAAVELGISEEAFKAAYHRFRKTFRANLRKEVSRLVGPDRELVDAEIRHLMAALEAKG